MCFFCSSCFLWWQRASPIPGGYHRRRPAVSAQGAVPERAVRLSLTAEGVAALGDAATRS